MSDEIPTTLAVIDCCATCAQFRGWLDNAWCGRYHLRVLPQTKCDTFEREVNIPIWIVAELVEFKREEL